jgi:hypothetical protein
MSSFDDVASNGLGLLQDLDTAAFSADVATNDYSPQTLASEIYRVACMRLDLDRPDDLDEIGNRAAYLNSMTSVLSKITKGDKYAEAMRLLGGEPAQTVLDALQEVRDNISLRQFFGVS